MVQSMDVQKLGSFIKALRLEKGITQKELGIAVGVSDKAVSKWERGLSFPDIALLPALVDTLDTTYVELINGEKNITDNIDIDAVEKVVGKTMEYSQETYKLKSRRIAFVIMIGIFFVAFVICLVVNLTINHAISWSLYPLGAMIMVSATLYSLLFSTSKTLETTALTFLATLALFLVLIRYLHSSSGWLLTLALPCALIGVTSVYAIAKSFVTFKNKCFAWATALLTFAIGPLVLIDVVVAANGVIRSADYSTVIGVPVLIVAAIALFIIGKRK